MPVSIRTGSKELKGQKPKIGFVADDEAVTTLDQRIKAREIEIVAIDRLKPNPRNPKSHPPRQVSLLAQDYGTIGVTQPIVVDEDGTILCGHARYEAARKAKLDQLPVVRLKGLTKSEKTRLAIADNKLAELGRWNFEILTEELKVLEVESKLDLRDIGFDKPSVEAIFTDREKQDRPDPADVVDAPDPRAPVVTRPGDLVICDEHRLLCGDAMERESYMRLMNQELADAVFTDPPSNFSIVGDISPCERELMSGSGGVSDAEYQEFMSRIAQRLFSRMVDGAVAYICLDWRQYPQAWASTMAVFGAVKNLIVWVKPSAAAGTFYGSQHEMILVCAAPGDPIKTSRGGRGRRRTDVWRYPAFNGFPPAREPELAMYSTIKPVAMVMDAIKDCSNRGSIILDPFAGSGTTMIAAERTNRRARLIEIDPVHCDTIVRRWQKFTGKTAHLVDGDTFDALARKAD